MHGNLASLLGAVAGASYLYDACPAGWSSDQSALFFQIFIDFLAPVIVCGCAQLHAITGMVQHSHKTVADDKSEVYHFRRPGELKEWQMAGLTAAQLEMIRGKLRQAELAIEMADRHRSNREGDVSLEIALATVRECQQAFSEDSTATQDAAAAVPMLEGALYGLQSFAGDDVVRGLRHIQDAVDALRPYAAKAGR